MQPLPFGRLSGSFQRDRGVNGAPAESSCIPDSTRGACCESANTGSHVSPLRACVRCVSEMLNGQFPGVNPARSANSSASLAPGHALSRRVRHEPESPRSDAGRDPALTGGVPHRHRQRVGPSSGRLDGRLWRCGATFPRGEQSSPPRTTSSCGSTMSAMSSTGSGASSAPRRRAVPGCARPARGYRGWGLRSMPWGRKRGCTRPQLAFRVAGRRPCAGLIARAAGLRTVKNGSHPPRERSRVRRQSVLLNCHTSCW